MSLLFCKSHGACGLAETCRHLNEKLKQDVFPECHKVDLAISWLLVCAECWARYDMVRFARYFDAVWREEAFRVDRHLENEFEQIYHEIRRSGWCVECIAEVRVNHARSRGEPDPLPVFERTLNSNHHEELDVLRQHLVSNFHFAESTRPYQYGQKDSYAVIILPGAYTRPLRVLVYYVTENTQQQRIVQLVEDFLRRQERNQARIEFYEAENWETWRDPETGHSGGRWGEEILLRAVTLNC